MDAAELQRRLMVTFATELQDHLRSLNRDLLELEQTSNENRRRALLTSLLRSAHSLKGAARAVAHDEIAVIAHRLEELFTAPFTKSTFDQAYSELDELQKHRGLGNPPDDSSRAGSPASMTSRDQTIRLQSQKLDSLLACTADLLVARRRAEERLSELTVLQESAIREWRKLAPRELRSTFDALTAMTRNLVADLRGVDQAASTLESRIAETRMLPFSEACEGLTRAVRDLAVAASKEVELVMRDNDVVLDRAILERLKDPLLHLVRNAVDHGIELPEERLLASKPRRGRVEIAARLNGSRVTITVSDDGRGIDLDAVRAKARSRSIAAPEDRHELVRLLLLPGFSTAPRVTDVSGRGVGLDVVKSRVESVHGTVSIAFERGRGTTFTMDVPLTLTITKGVLVTSAGQQYALLSANVEKLMRASSEDLHTLEARSVVLLDGGPVPVARLSDVLRRTNRGPIAPGTLLLAIVRNGERRVALIIDTALAEQEIAVSTLGRRLAGLRLAGGATLLPSGKVALVLNASELVDAALDQRHEIAIGTVPEPQVERKRLLVADDSITTRTLEKSILESAGYHVVTAADGEEAWRLLQERGADLVVSDVEMPRMDGFALAQAIRTSMRFRDLPVVLVTARENESDKLRGLEAGANAYLLKSAFDQRTLLETLRQLL